MKEFLFLFLCCSLFLVFSLASRPIDTKQTEFVYVLAYTRAHSPTVGGVAQWLERRSSIGELYACSMLDM